MSEGLVGVRLLDDRRYLEVESKRIIIHSTELVGEYRPI